MTLKALILDHSGVMSNDFASVLEAANDVLNSFGKDSINGDVLRKTFAAKPSDFFINLHPGLDSDECQKRYEHFFENKPKPNPLPGVINAIQSLFYKGMFLSVYSSHPSQFLIEDLERFEIADYFTLIKGSVNKQNSRHLKSFISKMFCVEKQQVAYIGDTNIDARLAKKANIPFYGVIGYQDRSFLENEGVPKERIFNSLSEVSEKILKNL